MRYEKYDTAFEPIVIPVAENFKDVCEIISSDYYRIHEETLSIWGCILQLIKGDYLAWFRFCQIKTPLLLLGKAIFKMTSYHAGVEIGWNTKIGYGFYMGHRRFIL